MINGKAKPEFSLYLGKDEEENRKALSLVDNLEPDYEVTRMRVGESNFFEKRFGQEALPALVGGQKPGTTDGGGRYFGVDNIEALVDLKT